MPEILEASDLLAIRFQLRQADTALSELAPHPSSTSRLKNCRRLLEMVDDHLGEEINLALARQAKAAAARPPLEQTAAALKMARLADELEVERYTSVDLDGA